mmetsp:Transcript_848/g.1974  ORF Transcript_848/g.1974 Transcript_848/m.1974 type:complete len:165 (-) Transcript_848:2936-3430(-)
MEQHQKPMGHFEAMRLPICQVEPYLYVGNKIGARDLDLLTRVGVRRVVQIQDVETRPFFPGQFNYLTFHLYDEDFEDIGALLSRSLPFIHQGIALQQPVFVHCDAGVSRSGSVIVAYLMASRDLTYQEALRQAKLARGCISPNKGFRRQIEEIGVANLRGYLQT